MKQERMTCEGCSRGCSIVLTEKDGKYYLQGNTCTTGEQKARENWAFLMDKEVVAGGKTEKKGFFSRLFKK